ncbi:hypothetical protein NT05LI_0499 [Listeria ivanovii FSL F6-596]|nr:hypothetical protein NT05LI_0499 [Listeria ivanovii FSL F6-596]
MKNTIIMTKIPCQITYLHYDTYFFSRKSSKTGQRPPT